MFTNVKSLRNNIQKLPDKPGVYAWWARENELQIILNSLDLQYVVVKHSLEELDGYYCVYVGIAARESVKSRLNWHINQQNTISSVKSGFLSTLRQSIAGILNVPMTDTAAVNAFMDELYVSYSVFECPIKSDQAKQKAHAWENAKLISGELYVLNIQGNSSSAPCKTLKQLRKAARTKAL